MRGESRWVTARVVGEVVGARPLGRCALVDNVPGQVIGVVTRGRSLTRASRRVRVGITRELAVGVTGPPRSNEGLREGLGATTGLLDGGDRSSDAVVGVIGQSRRTRGRAGGIVVLIGQIAVGVVRVGDLVAQPVGRGEQLAIVVVGVVDGRGRVTAVGRVRQHGQHPGRVVGVGDGRVGEPRTQVGDQCTARHVAVGVVAVRGRAAGVGRRRDGSVHVVGVGVRRGRGVAAGDTRVGRRQQVRVGVVAVGRGARRVSDGRGQLTRKVSVGRHLARGVCRGVRCRRRVQVTTGAATNWGARRAGSATVLVVVAVSRHLAARIGSREILTSRVVAVTRGVAQLVRGGEHVASRVVDHRDISRVRSGRRGRRRFGGRAVVRVGGAGVDGEIRAHIHRV